MKVLSALLPENNRQPVEAIFINKISGQQRFSFDAEYFAMLPTARCHLARGVKSAGLSLGAEDFPLLLSACQKATHLIESHEDGANPLLVVDRPCHDTFCQRQTS